MRRNRLFKGLPPRRQESSGQHAGPNSGLAGMTKTDAGSILGQSPSTIYGFQDNVFGWVDSRGSRDATQRLSCRVTYLHLALQSQ